MSDEENTNVEVTLEDAETDEISTDKRKHNEEKDEENN